MDIPKKPQPRLSRRILLLLGSVFLIYPLIRFINHRLPRKPRTIEVSGTILPGSFVRSEEFYIFSSDNETWAVSRTCTHLGCRVNYKENEGVLECPCHQSKFKSTGEVVHGPAQKALERYSVEQLDEPPRLIVTIK